MPSILMLVVSHTILTKTLETKILRDRQTFVQLIAHLVGDDLGGKSTIIEYYQTLPEMTRLLTTPNPALAGQQWLGQTFFSHPRIDGMFLTDADGRLIASVPSNLNLVGQDFGSALWKKQALAATGAIVSPVHPREPDRRIVTDIVGAVRGPDGKVVGFLGVSVLVERIGRRLSTIGFTDQSVCQILDQNGAALFTQNFEANSSLRSPEIGGLISVFRKEKNGYTVRGGNVYSFTTLESSGWTTVLRQPTIVAYKPVEDFLNKMTVLSIWMMVLTTIFAWLGAKFYRRQAEASSRIEREVIFNEKILANMPSGIALIDPGSHHFLQANQAFADMATRFGQLPEKADVHEANYDEVKIAPSDAIEKVLRFGAPFQLIEHPFVDRAGQTRFVNVNLLRLQGSDQTVQGVLYLVEDKTRDVTLRQELINANAAKDQFLALLSHELRNPLTPVIAMVGELEAITDNTPAVREALEIIRRNVELEARLIDDLLDVTRISKGKLQLSFEVASVHEILRRAYEICGEEIEEKTQRVEFRLKAERDYVEADPARLQQVFWNLIKNAVKFTPPGGRVIIETFNPQPNEIEIKVTDTGIGIESGKIDKIFNAFEQGQSSITRRFGGLGLGLAISKAMVAAHGGQISVTSTGKDQGASFTVRLDTVETPAPAAETKTLPAAPASSSVRNQNGQPHHVLVVDDHPDTCRGMKLMLERRGYKISVAHTADQAVKRALSSSFDLVISDIGLPDRSGYELMEELTTRFGLRGIALSGFGMESDIQKAHEAGFAAHLTKPINFDRLEDAIRRLLDRSSPTVSGDGAKSANHETEGT